MPFPCPNFSSVRPFCPPIFFVQILLERISSPWEPNFAAIPGLQLLFTPQNVQPKLSITNSQIQVGKGRHFFIRPPKSNSSSPELGWLELRAKGISSSNLPSDGWMGRIDLNQLVKNGPVQVDCDLKCASGPSLSAHLVLNVGEVEQKMANENLGRELAEKGIQTEEIGRRAEKGTQTIEEQRRNIKDEVGEGQRFSRKTMLRLMVLMMLRMRKTQNGQEKTKPKMESRSTLTQLSIPPRGDELFKMLSNRKRTEIGQCRARIGYLSALYRTMVPAAKEAKMEKNLRKIKKKVIYEEEIGRRGRKIDEGKGGNDLLLKMAPRIGETFLEERRPSSSPSSGLQSMEMESGRGSKSSEESENVESKVGFFRSEKINERNGKRNDGNKLIRTNAIGQIIQKQRQIEANEQSLLMGGSRFATLDDKNIKSRGKSSFSSPSAASIIHHQQSEYSSGQSNNGTIKDVQSGSKSSSSASSSSSPTQHSESISKSSKSSSVSSGRKKISAIQSFESASRSNSKTDSSITEMVASSVKTDSSVPIEIQSVASPSSSNSETIIEDEEKGRRRQSSNSKFLHDLRKQVLNDL